ncbi:spore germination protein GerPC [Ammoniphilus sp. YIM 78166]|uniref:spore germination protein GerPC n=1 Tax=Ammoniphilus sp. YIM 78166 TaxID=1644106 RepID=UPI00106FE4A7|nr:spore germination protein GerPC [Ammoniphilus sp. YIM 78166]
MHQMPYPYHNSNLLKQLEERIEQLEKQNEELKEKVDKIKPITIENINYKIQELTVEELSGTLNIGMTALTDPEELKKWMGEAEEGEAVVLNDMEQGPEVNGQ